MKYAAICENSVILVIETEEKPNFAPTADGREVTAIEIYPDEKVCIGMTYTEEEGFKGECPEPPKPQPTEIEILQKENKLLKAQVNALAEQQEFLEDCLIEIGQVVYA